MPRKPNAVIAISLLVVTMTSCSSGPKPKATDVGVAQDMKTHPMTKGAEQSSSTSLALQRDGAGLDPQKHSWTYLGRSVSSNVYVFRFAVSSGAETQSLDFISLIDEQIHDRKVLLNQSVELVAGDEDSVELVFTSLPRRIRSTETHLGFIADDQILLPGGKLVTYEEAQYWNEPRWVGDVLFSPVADKAATELKRATPELSASSNQALFWISKEIPTEKLLLGTVTELSEGTVLETEGGVRIRLAQEDSKIWLHVPGREPIETALSRDDVVQIGPKEFLQAAGPGSIVVLEPTQMLNEGQRYQLRRGELATFGNQVFSFIGSLHESSTSRPNGPEQVSHLAEIGSMTKASWPRSATDAIKSTRAVLRVYEKGFEQLEISGNQYRLRVLDWTYDQSVEIRIDKL